MNTYLIAVDSGRKSEGLRTSIIEAESVDDVMDRYFGRGGANLRWTAFKLREKQFYSAYRVYSSDDDATHGIITILAKGESK